MIQVAKVQGGYIVEDDHSVVEVMTSLEEVFGHMLLQFEGRSQFFEGDSFGVVEIHRKPTAQHPEEVPA